MKKRERKAASYNPKPTPRKLIITILALVLGNILFAYSATISSSKPISTFFFNPAVLSTSILLAAASYVIISLVKE
jgi:hypothetical protein